MLVDDPFPAKMILVPRLGSFDYWSGGFCGSHTIRMVQTLSGWLNPRQDGFSLSQDSLILFRIAQSPSCIQYGYCHLSRDGLVPR
jgi:hypothetical protein